jgi:hypothetical protein
MNSGNRLNWDECGWMSLYLLPNATIEVLPRIINSTFLPIASACWRRPNGRASNCPVGTLPVLLRTNGLVKIPGSMTMCRNTSRPVAAVDRRAAWITLRISGNVNST